MRRVHREGLDGTGDGNEAWRTAQWRKRTCVGALRSKRGSCSSGGVWRTAKRDSTGYCSSPPSTPSSLHELLFIHRRPPPASTCDCSSTGFCSSSLHRALLHRLLFNHPSTGTPPPSTVHPAPTGSIDWGPVHPEATPRGPVHPPPLGTVHPPPPPATLIVHPRGSIDWLQLAAVAKESLDRVQLTAIDRSLGFSNA